MIEALLIVISLLIGMVIGVYVATKYASKRNEDDYDPWTP